MFTCNNIFNNSSLYSDWNLVMNTADILTVQKVESNFRWIKAELNIRCHAEGVLWQKNRLITSSSTYGVHGAIFDLWNTMPCHTQANTGIIHAYNKYTTVLFAALLWLYKLWIFYIFAFHPWLKARLLNVQNMNTTPKLTVKYFSKFTLKCCCIKISFPQLFHKFLTGFFFLITSFVKDCTGFLWKTCLKQYIVAFFCLLMIVPAFFGLYF